MTKEEILNKIAFDYRRNFWSNPKEKELIQKAMQLYAQQFIDAANEIIGPACDVLDENYDEEYDNWHEIQEINEVNN